jgi:hypothetical protein
VQLVPGPVEVKFEVAGQAHAGQLAQLGLAVEGTHGGQIMVAGNYAVEIVADGEFVHAYVFDASGEAHAKGEFDLDLQVGAGTELALVWDPPSASYKAKVEGDFDLEAKPVVLEITVEGIVSVAAVQSFSAKASADAVADLDVDAVANVDASARVAAPKVSARAEASKSGSAKATADVDKSASAEGSAKTGSSGAKASGSAKAGFKFGVGN